MLLNCGVGEDSWEFLDCKEIQPVHPKRDQSWIFIGGTDVEAETPILWPPDAKNWFIWRDPDAGKDWGQEDKGMTEVEMVGWHHWLNGHGFGWTPGVGDGQGGLACCDSWGRKESDMTEWLNWTELNWNRVERAEGELSCPVVGNLTNLSRCVPEGLGYWLLTEGSQLIPTADYSDSASFLSFSSHILSVHYIPGIELGRGSTEVEAKSFCSQEGMLQP